MTDTNIRSELFRAGLKIDEAAKQQVIGPKPGGETATPGVKPAHRRASDPVNHATWAKSKAA
jgi:hypothetical protein